MQAEFYVGTLAPDGAIVAVAGPFFVAREASDARIPLVGHAEKYSIPVISRRSPRPVRMVSLDELQRIHAEERKKANRRR